jgi:hypothetical protein
VTLKGLSVNDGSLDLSIRSNLPDAVYPFLSPERRPILSALHVRTAGTAPKPPTPTPTPTVDPTSEAALRAEMARLNRELEAKRASVTALLLQYCGSPTTECALPPGATTTLYRNLVQAVDELIRQLDAVTRTYWLLYGQP